ncbi:MAG TPA: lasso peptide biosynthesis B2 protein [Gemmatimonadaceae bacterium]|nr:lasso peptide biosynthesis B2 protein [Gemmatimonadaceae bacterium]
MARCFAVIAVVKARLAIYGLGPTLRWIRRHEASVPCTALAPTAFVTACEYAIALAASLYPGRALCLERSLALFYFARRIGIPVTYHHGVQPLPFAAHAWIEYQGRVVNDAVEHVQEYRRLPQVCP